jgi:hypothetical protein
MKQGWMQKVAEANESILEDISDDYSYHIWSTGEGGGIGDDLDKESNLWNEGSVLVEGMCHDSGWVFKDALYDWEGQIDSKILAGGNGRSIGKISIFGPPDGGVYLGTD